LEGLGLEREIKPNASIALTELPLSWFCAIAFSRNHASDSEVAVLVLCLCDRPFSAAKSGSQYSKKEYNEVMEWQIKEHDKYKNGLTRWKRSFRTKF
jgi:hypothetical protein